MDVLKKINKMRIERDWSIYRLSLESGIAQSTLNNMFNRETLPSITTLECICHAFGVSMSKFFLEASDEGANVAEAELLELYRSLSDESQKSLVCLLRELNRKSTR